jgi:hypothetical protein
MGTRGFITFVADGTEKTTYNHFDSYPDGLGKDVLHYLRECSVAGSPDHRWNDGTNTRPTMAGIRQRALELRVMSPGTPPSPEDIAQLAAYSWGATEHGGTDDLRPGQEWYDLLHRTQGDVHEILSAGVIEDNSEFPLDSLFAEWGYVIDMDGDGMFEVYKGFQRSPHTAGRFADRTHPDAEPVYEGGPAYYPCAMIAAWPLAQLPSDEEFLSELLTQDEEEE